MRASALLRATLVAVGICACCLLWSRSAFQYDDLHAIVENAHLRSPTNVPLFFFHSEMFSANTWGGMYRPMVLLFHSLSWAVGDGKPGPFRMLNAGLHGANSGLVVLLLSVVGLSAGTAVFGGLVFGLVPINGEVVWYFSSRSESLCAFFFMSSFVLYAMGLSKGRRWWPWSASSCAALVLAMLSKEVAVVLPVLLTIWDWSRGPRQGFPGPATRGILRRQWPHWTVVTAYLIGMHEHLARATIREPVRSWGVQLATQAKAWAYYLYLLWQPTRLSVEHQFRLANSWSSALPVAAATVLLGSLFWRLAHLRRRGEVLFLACWAVASLLPTTLVPLNVLVNEHRLYLPSVAFSGLIAWAAGDLWRRRSRVGLLVALGFVAVLGTLFAQRSAVWADAGTLWSDAVGKAPLMPRPHLFLADYHFGECHFERALEEYSLAETVYPDILSTGDRLQLHNNRGATLLAMGRFPEAVREYQAALRIDSTYGRSREALEGLLAMAGSERESAAQSLHERGLSALVAGRVPDAIRLFRASLERQSWPDTWLAVGMAEERLGRLAEARSAYESLKIAGRGTGFEETARRRLAALEARP